MTSMRFGAVALATGVMGIVLALVPAQASQEEAPKAEGVKCYLLGCYDEEGNKVDPQQTASVSLTATQAAEGVATAKGDAAEKPATPFHNIVARHAAENGVSLDLAHAVIEIESNYRQSARGRAGEIGLMQIKPATARMMGYSGSNQGLFDPETNIRYGMKYLAKAQNLGDGSVCQTILRYNAGHAATRMNRISANYCSKVKQRLAGA